MERTHTCGELRKEDAGKSVVINGWLAGKRDIGAIVFAVVRDFYGMTQVTISDAEMMERVRAVPVESTVSVAGKVVLRSSPNPDMPTGMIEIVPKEIAVLGKCYSELPFEIGASKDAKEDLRLKYRFLDLRNPAVKEKIIMRFQIISEIRRIMNEIGFLEIATPILTSSSPEGARDYIVPSRLHPGKFYALPQAPQQYKQLLMCSGFDRYFQIAPCFRDEDARADRSPGEFYQLDMEMAFAGQEDVFAVLENILPRIFGKFSTWKTDKPPFVRIPYRQALETFGTDKPDLRNPLRVADVTDILQNCGFSALSGKVIKAVAVHNFKGNRKFIDNLCAEMIAKEYADAVYWFKVNEDGTYGGGIAKYLTPEIQKQLEKQFLLKKDSFVAVVAADKLPQAQKKAGILRNMLGQGLELLDKNIYKFCWIVDFPMYEFNEETNAVEFCHNPFSMPQGGMEALCGKDPLDILAYQYDIVCNGIELSSGAVRNHEPEAMVKAFEIAGISKETVEEKFSALYNAFKFGAPPHAGIAPGVDRMVMLLCDTPNIREVITFPMNKNAQDLMMNAPSTVSEKQLREAHIKLRVEN